MAAGEFATEAALCDAFAEWVRAGHMPICGPWTVYPETGDFDLLLVHEDGRQIGIEAKLRFNLKVLSQAIPSPWSAGVGPDHRAVLVPSVPDGMVPIATMLGLVIFENRGRGAGFACSGWPDNWFDWFPMERCPLPDTVPEVAAGVPSPIRLTPWKQGALHVLALLEVHGEVTAEQVRQCGIDPRRWCASDGFLKQGSRRGYWRRGDHMPNFAEQHPGAYAAALERARAAAKPNPERGLFAA